MYLVDTNVWLERLLDQERSDEVGRFLNEVPSERLFMTDFAFHSISIAMSGLKETGALLTFVSDAFIRGNVGYIALGPQETGDLTRVIDRFNLDFDDAYQYVAAQKYGLTIVSFDRDFDRTDLGRKTPGELLQLDSGR